MNPTWTNPFVHSLWDIWWLIWIALCVRYLSKPENWVDYVLNIVLVAFWEWQYLKVPRAEWSVLFNVVGIAFTAWTISLPYTRKRKDLAIQDAQRPEAHGAADPESKSPDTRSQDK